jgi:glucokinase
LEGVFIGMSGERIAIGLDLGGTYIKAGLITETGQTIGRWKEKTHADQGPEAVLDSLVNVARMILESDEMKDYCRSNKVRAEGIGIGSPGVINPYEGKVVIATHNLPGWSGTDIRSRFEREFDLKTSVNNDANAYMWGEYHFGVGKDRKIHTMVGLTLGTGLGGGVISDGRLLMGAHGAATELGHIIVSDRDDAPPCSTGIRGTFESFACAPPVVRYAEERKSDYPDSLIFEKAKQKGKVTARLVHEAALEGDTLAQQTIERTAYYLGLGLASLINCYDPDVIVVGGGVGNMGETLLEPTRQVVREYVYFSNVIKVDIVQAKLGGDDGYKGAAALALFPCV